VLVYQRVGEMHAKEIVVDLYFAGKFSFTISECNINTLKGM
jgi:hypothetical protein